MGNQPDVTAPINDTNPSPSKASNTVNHTHYDAVSDDGTSVDNSPTISNEMMTITRMRRSSTKRDSIHNGVVGIFIPLKSVKLTSDFWNTHISQLDFSSQLEIACSIFFGMVSTDQAIKTLFVGSNNAHKLETVGLKFLDMMGYMIRRLMANDMNLHSSLKLLGSLHAKRGVTFQMYERMLHGMHDSFSYYFTEHYTVQVKLAVHEVFSVVARLMSNKPVVSHVRNLNIAYLESLHKCLVSLDGKAALLSYLKQCGCDNMVLFYDLLRKFKSKTSDTERFMVARDIVRFQIDGIHGKAKKIEISSQTAQNVLVEIRKIDDLWFSKVPFVMDISFFDEVEAEVNALVAKHHWNGFKQSILSSQ